MDFSDIRYWFVLAGWITAFAVFGRICGHPVGAMPHKAVLIAIGLSALLLASPESLFVFLVVCSLSWFAARHLARRPVGPSRARSLAVFVPLILFPLLYFKYRFFILSQIGIPCPRSPLSGSLPIGISFYTFQAIGFVVDTARRSGPFPSFVDFLCFESFVPQIVAGPIERKSCLLPQIRSFRFKWNASDVEWGVRYIVLGLFFKLCLGDNLALCHPRSANGNVFALWLANVSFGLRIYFDFCGYGLAAFGLSRCLGVRLTQNFAAPYSATNITDFWRRWHRSLTNWFRDYLYFPLGGGRTSFWALNLLVVFLLSGLWHGASWNFVLWGGVNGLALIVHKWSRKHVALKLPRFVARILLLVFVFYSWMFFDVRDGAALVADHALLFDPRAYSKEALSAFFLLFRDCAVVSCFMIPLSATVVFLESLCVRGGRNPYGMLLSIPALCIEVFLIFLLSSGHANEFIYFAF